MEVAGWVASPIISELFQKCSSYLAFDASEKLQQLEPKVLLLERAMQAVERSPDRPRLEKLSENLRTAFYEAEDILDDIEYRCLEKKIQDDKFRSDDSAPPRKRDWVKKTVKSALPGSLLKNKETGTSKNELKDSLEKIEDIINEACTLLKKLNLSSISDFNGTQAVATMSRGAATTSAPQPVVIGRDKDRDKIIAMLHEKDGDGQPITNNGLCYSVIGIHGIGGSGKSTLAQLVCARERMDRQEKRDDHFDLVMWVHVSQSFSVDAIFKEIFEAATGDSCPQLDNLDTLQNKLEEKLHGKRFLLVLDDIWCNIRDERQKGNLRQILSPLKAGEAGSKILVTSRTEDALSVMGAAKPKRIPISDLDDDVFQSLLMHYAFEGAAIDDHVRSRLNAIGGEIAKKLKGSPLAARIVGGQLGRRPDVEFWTRFKDKKLVDGTMGALRWSYHHLSPQARRCFAYCSIFPRRHHLHRGELVKLWVAEGFIRNTGEGEEMEDVCREHFDELVSTSFLQPGVKEHKDDNKYYLLHDLLHDLAETVAGSDCFRIENDLTWRGGDLIDDGWTGGIPNPRDVRHLFVQRYDGELITEKILQLENLRTLIIYTITGDDTTVEEKVIESIFKRLPKLRVLAIACRDHCKRLLERPDILSVSESICQLKHLRYLGFHPPRSCRIILPSTLTKLYHIQHLDFGLCEEIEFPPADLINLGHVSFYKGPTSPGKEDARRIRPWAVMGTERRVLALALAFRAVNALLVRTYFNPDEHWQCLEVAHRVAFGYGHLTWEWKQGLRSYLHPLIFAALYKILALLHLDTPWFMVMAPRLLQSVFASFGDLYLYKLSKLIFDDHVAQWTLFSQLVNWFMFFCITRTLSNSLETVLTVAGLYYWFMAIESSKGTSVVSKQQATSYQNDPSRKVALLIAALACAIRPTSAITWLYVGLLDFIQIKSKCQFLFLEVIPLGVIVLAVTTFLDWWMYGSWVIVPLNFLKFNLFSSGGDYYGTHIFHWYFTQGFPSMVWTFLPFSVFGVMKSREWRLSGLIAWVLGVYSILGHKEFRFVLPVLPLALMFSGYCLASTSRFKGKSLHRRGHLSRLQLSVILLIISNVPMALYMSIFHQRGTEDVMFYLSKEAHDGRVKAVLFLMPCHSTPYYSTLHKSLPMRFLDCTPSENIGILDESDRFLMNPPDFVGEVFGNLSSFSHIVLYESEERHILQFLLHDSFQEVRRFFHSHFKIDRDLQSSVVVYSRRDVL